MQSPVSDIVLQEKRLDRRLREITSILKTRQTYSYDEISCKKHLQINHPPQVRCSVETKTVTKYELDLYPQAFFFKLGLQSV